MDDRLQRKLTTIVVADVAGYSRLMGRDEEGTHARLEALRGDLLKPAVDAHGGRLIKDTGDGFLAEFASVVEAVRCAMEIQQGAAARNAGIPPEQHVGFRFGINLGDVIVEGADIYGEGVNVAARLEGLAEPGGIVVSRAVRDHIRDRLSLVFQDMGEQAVKNIARPVRAFRVRAETGAHCGTTIIGRRSLGHARLAAFGVLAGLSVVGALWWKPSLPSWAMWPAAHTEPTDPASRLSILVLPFVNLSGDPQQDYLADGITDSLTTDLSRALPGSFVVARGTAFTYKGKLVDTGQVGRDLNVRYVIAGSVLPSGERLRVNAQLLDARTNSELWAERFDKTRSDVLEVQDQIVGRLSRAAGLQVIDIEARRSERERSANPTAIDLLMRGQAIANRPASRETMIAARDLFQGRLRSTRTMSMPLPGSRPLTFSRCSTAITTRVVTSAYGMRTP